MARTPWWLQAITVYALIRILMVPVFLVALHSQGANLTSYPDGPPDFWTFLSRSWDGEWYARIAENGYPSELPRDAETGVVLQNAWAFFPLYPSIVSLVMAVTGLPWEVAAPSLSLIFGAGAIVVLWRLVVVGAPQAVFRFPRLPLAAVAAFSAFPSAAAFTVAYSESLAALLIITSLLLISRQRYYWAILPIVALGFTRAVALPLVCVVVWHLALRWRSSRKAHTPLPISAVVGCAALGVVSVVSGLIWPSVVGFATGSSAAYFETQSAWRAGATTSVPFLAWSQRLDEKTGGLGLLVVAALIVAIVLIASTRPVRRLGGEMQSWGAAYPIYLIGVGTLSSSLVRFALLDIALQVLLVSWARRIAWTLPVIALLLVGQAIWILQFWVWTPPKGGLTP